MADFALWVSAAEPDLGWPEGAFLDAYEHNRTVGVEQSIESDPIAAVIIEITEGKDHACTTVELLDRLTKKAPDEIRSSRWWPRAPNVLGRRLRRLAPALREIGIEVSWSRSDGRRIVAVKRPAASSVEALQRTIQTKQDEAVRLDREIDSLSERLATATRVAGASEPHDLDTEP